MIKVLIPAMPTADELLPYLRRIDEARVYVNGGPMVQLLTAELEQRVVMAPCAVVSNGTLALELALRAMDLPRGSEVLVPAVTYVASGQAIVNAGLTPLICDASSNGWHLIPEYARGVVKDNTRIRAVMPVAAFGAPVRIRAWERFADETGLPVLIDAAGAIHEQPGGTNQRIAIAYSLHATKSLGAGEGGVVATYNRALLERIAALANFGPGGTNAKMSEYHAAAALASMQHASLWRADVDRWYASGRLRGVFYQRIPLRARTLLPVLLPYGMSASVVQALLLDSGIETKLWYRPYLDEREEFFGCPRIGPMPVTEMLRDRLLGLPYHAFLTEEEVRHVCSRLAEIIG